MTASHDRLADRAAHVRLIERTSIMRALLLGLGCLLAALVICLPFQSVSAAPPYTVTVTVTGDDAQGLEVRLAAGEPGQTTVKILIGADNTGTAQVMVGGFYEMFAPNGFTPQQQSINMNQDRQLDFTYTDPFGGGGGGGGGGGTLPAEDYLLVKHLKSRLNTKKVDKDKLDLKAEIHTASGFTVGAANALTLQITPTYTQTFDAGAFVAKGKSGRKFVFQDATTKATLILRKQFGAKPDKLVLKRRKFSLGTDVGAKGTRTVTVTTGTFDEQDLE